MNKVNITLNNPKNIEKKRNENIENILKNNPLFPVDTGLHKSELRIYTTEKGLEIEGVDYSIFLDRWGRRGRPDTMILDSLPKVVQEMGKDPVIKGVVQKNLYNVIKGVFKQ